MMQSCASAAKLRGGGPILNRGSKTMCKVGLPPPRIVICSSISIGKRTAESQSCLSTGKSSRRRAQEQTCRRLAGGHQPPKRNEELAGQRHDHGLARAAAGIRGSFPIPLGQHAVLLMQQVTPGELDHRTAHAGIAGFGKSSLASFLAALVRGPVRPAYRATALRSRSLREKTSCTSMSSALDADPDHPGEQVDHRIATVSGRSFQSLGSCRLDLLDLLLHEAQTGHVALQLG